MNNNAPFQLATYFQHPNSRIFTLVVGLLVLLFNCEFADAQKFDWKKANQIHSPGSGLGGVFIVTDSNGKKIVAKFVAEQPDNSIFAERVLELVGITTTGTQDYKSSSRQYKTAVKVIKELKSKPGVEQRVKDVYDNTVESATSVLLQDYIEGAAGAESVAHALTCFRDDRGQRIAAVSTAVMQADPEYENRLRQVNAVLSAIADVQQQKNLGKLNVVDAFLGNEDRTLKLEMNTANLMLQENPRVFVAIDNFAAVPDAKSIGWHLAASEISLTNEFNNASSKKRKSKYKYTAKYNRVIWYEKLTKGFWYWRGSNELLTANMQGSLDFDAESQRIADALKSHLKKTLVDVSAAHDNSALLPKSVNGKATNAWLANPDSATAWNISIVNSIKDSQSGNNGTHLSRSEYSLDWVSIRQNIRLGMVEARTDLLNAAKDSKGKLGALKNTRLGKIQKSLSSQDKYNEISLEALELKIGLLNAYPANKDFDSIRTQLLTKPDSSVAVKGPWYLQAETVKGRSVPMIFRK